MINKNDKASLALLRAGKPEGLRLLFDSYFDEICRYAFILTGNEEASKDIVQQLFVDLWENKSTVNIHTSVKSYLYTAAKHRSLNYLRKQNRLLSIDEFESGIMHVTDNEIDNIIDIKELDLILRQSIDSLPTQCREIFTLKIHENLSYKDIAHKLSLSEKTIENQMGIAYKKLRMRLKSVFEQLLSLVF